MRSLLPMMLLAACSGGSSASSTCPTAEDLRARAHLDETDAPFLATQCRHQDWPAAVTECIRDATDEHAVDGCLNRLDDTRKKALKEASRAVMHDEHATEFPVLVAKVRADLDAKVFTMVIFTRDHACDGLRHAIDDTVARLVPCPTGDSLRLYGGYSQILHDVSEIAKAPAETASQACRQYEAEARRAFECR